VRVRELASVAGTFYSSNVSHLTSSGSKSLGGTTTANKHLPGPAMASLLWGLFSTVGGESLSGPAAGGLDDAGPHEGLFMLSVTWRGRRRGR
jgi:hypothetical protein